MSLTEATSEVVNPQDVPGRRFNVGVVMYPDEVLSRVCAPLVEFGEAVVSLAKWFATVQKVHNARGIAAPQVGIPARMFLFMDGAEHHVVVNPEIVETSVVRVDWEACLSIPGSKPGWPRAQVPRSTRVSLVGKTPEGDDFEFETEDALTARAIQHEIDHLNGVLFVDYLSKLKRDRVNKKFSKAAKRAEE